MEGKTKPGNTVAERTISAFPLSIGTSLSFESIFEGQMEPYDKTREIPTKINLNNYQEFWISLYTLYRNIYGACSKQAAENMSVQDIINTLEQEIDVIESLFLNEGAGLVKPYFYFNDYQPVVSKYTPMKVQFREDKTETQKAFNRKFLLAMKSMVTKNSNFQSFTGKIRPVKATTSAMIISHIPYDLLSHKNFRRLDLLESHTGVLKPKYNWSTKYAAVGENDLTNLPFIKRLLLVFGDKVLIKPSFYELRMQILNIAKNRNWTTFTTDERVKYDLSLDIKEGMVIDFLMKL